MEQSPVLGREKYKKNAFNIRDAESTLYQFTSRAPL